MKARNKVIIVETSNEGDKQMWELFRRLTVRLCDWLDIRNKNKESDSAAELEKKQDNSWK